MSGVGGKGLAGPNLQTTGRLKGLKAECIPTLKDKGVILNNIACMEQTRSQILIFVLNPVWLGPWKLLHRQSPK